MNAFKYFISTISFWGTWSLNTSKTKFNMIEINESCLKKGISPLSKIGLQNYKIEHTPTESEKGGS